MNMGVKGCTNLSKALSHEDILSVILAQVNGPVARV